MAPFSDPLMNHLMECYWDSNLRPQFLYQGSQDNIIKELQAWIVRRKEVYKGQMEVRDQAQKASKEVMSGQVQPSAMPASMRASMSMMARSNALDNEAGEDTKRAIYLLHTLKSRGFTWPELWWRPEDDGGVCSFLGTVDESFDAHATLAVLEDREEEERLQATRANVARQFDDAMKGMAEGKAKKGNDASGSSQTKSRQEKRAEARAQEKDSKQTKGS